jgi:hypothetical protein
MMIQCLYCGAQVPNDPVNTMLHAIVVHPEYMLRKFIDKHVHITGDSKDVYEENRQEIKSRSGQDLR